MTFRLPMSGAAISKLLDDLRDAMTDAYLGWRNQDGGMRRAERIESLSVKVQFSLVVILEDEC
jgi:hypothetical protein